MNDIFWNSKTLEATSVYFIWYISNIQKNGTIKNGSRSDSTAMAAAGAQGKKVAKLLKQGMNPEEIANFFEQEAKEKQKKKEVQKNEEKKDDPKKEKKSYGQAAALTKDEMGKWLSACRSFCAPWFWVHQCILFFTAGRNEEALLTRAEDIDLEKGVIHIPKQHQKGKNSYAKAKCEELGNALKSALEEAFSGEGIEDLRVVGVHCKKEDWCAFKCRPKGHLFQGKMNAKKKNIAAQIQDEASKIVHTQEQKDSKMKKLKDLQDKYEDANHLAPNTVYIQIENLKKKLLAEDEQSVKDNEDKIKEELAEWAEENPAASEMRIKSQRLDIEDKYRKWAFVLRCFN